MDFELEDDDQELEQDDRYDEEIDEKIDQDTDYALLLNGEAGKALETQPMKIRIRRTLPNRVYPLTRFEKAKAISERARILDRLLGAKVQLPADVQEKINILEKEYTAAADKPERRQEIKNEISDLLTPVYEEAQKVRREYINLTDEEIDVKDDKITIDKYDPIRLAMLEYRFRKLPINIVRVFPDGKRLEKNINDLIQEDQGLFIEAAKDLPSIPDLIPF